ncbi:hypothetical protein AHAS_Ahas20G0159600 [Arachis hypogaea]
MVVSISIYGSGLYYLSARFHVGLKGQYSGSKEEKYFIHNHVALTVKYHRDLLTKSATIVGFEVKPFILVFL